MQLSSPGLPGLFAPRRCTKRRLCRHKFATLCMVCQIPISKDYTEGAECCCTNRLPGFSTPTSLSWPPKKDLNWLSMRGRAAELTTKIAILCYKAVKFHQPSYISALLSPYRQSHVLRLSASDLLSAQSSSTNTASHRFSCCALTVWYSLPSFVRTADSVTI